MRRFLILAVLSVSGALLVPSVASAALRFEGRTSQCPPEQASCYAVNILLPSSLAKVSRFEVFWEAGCNSGNKITNVSTLATNLTLSRALKFRGAGDYAINLEDPARPATVGLKGNVSATFSGKVRRNGNGSGAFTAGVVMINAAGREVDRCDTGAVTWRANLR